MLKFAASYSKVFAALLLLMGVYCLVLVPAIEPAHQITQPPPPFSRSLGGEQWWQVLFPSGSWQTQDPKVIYTDKGILLANSWTQISEKAWELKPLTMIVPQMRSENLPFHGKQSAALAEQDMWIVSAEEGATVHFEEPLDPVSATVPKLLRGVLSGATEVTRRVAAEDHLPEASRKSLRIRTYDLTIDRRQLSTQREVVIEWNDSVIQGRALKILLRGDLLSDQGSGSSAWGPLDELELYHIDQIDVALPPGGLWANMEIGRFAEQPELRILPARLIGHCGGRFTFDFNSGTATLQNGVRLVHQLGELPPDEFLCDKVSVTVEPPARSDPADLAPQMGGIEINELVATGVDSLREFVGEKWVELRAPTIDLVARGKSLIVDFNRQRVEFDGRIDNPGATKSNVSLNYQGWHIRSPRVEYQATRNADVGTARHLGYMYAEGPGELDSSAANELGETHIRWHESLKMAPISDDQQTHWIQLVGNTLVESKKYGILTSNTLQLWLKQNEERSLIPAPNPVGSISDQRYLPDRLLAVGNAILVTTALRVEVDDIDIDVVHAPSSQAPKQPDGLALSDSAGNPMHQWVQPPAAGPQSTNPSRENPVALTRLGPTDATGVDQKPTAEKRAAQPNPAVITGRSMVARIVATEEDSAWIDQLRISGPVTVLSESRTERSTGPVSIVGDQLLLSTNRAGFANMQIEGRPAKILVAEGSLQSSVIGFDQARNLIWMDQPGEFTIPTSVLNDSNQSGQNGITWFDAPHCRWQGRMFFDGDTAQIEGDIAFEAGLRTAPNQFWRVNGVSQQLNISLSNRLDLKSSAENAMEIERIVLNRNVNIRASEIDRDGNKQSREQIVVPSLTFHVAQNQVVASGPGWIKSQFPSSGRLGQMASSTPARTRKNTSLQGAHLKFNDSMVAFLQRNELVFDGRVVLAAGPITSWDQSIDVDQIQSLAPQQMLLNCDQMKVYDTSQLSSIATLTSGGSNEAWEFQAIGNVFFNGKSDTGEYSGNGYQVTYVQAKEQLYLRGDGRTPAFLKSVPTQGDKRTFTAYLNTGQINPRTLDTSNLQIVQVESRSADSPTLNRTPAGSPPNAPNPRRDFYKRNGR